MQSNLLQTTSLATKWQMMADNYMDTDSELYKMSQALQKFWQTFPSPEQLYWGAIRKPATTGALLSYKLWQLVNGK
jgi:hypothetical protein